MTDIPAASENVRIAAIGLIKVREKAKLARKHLPGFRDFFKSQRDLVLEQFAAMEPHFTVATEAKTNKIPPSALKAALEQFGDLWLGIDGETRKELQELVVAAEMDGMQSGSDFGRKTLQPGGVTPESKTFTLENPRAVKFFKETGGSVKYIRGINDTTAESLKTLIANSLDEGRPYSATAREIQKLYDGPISRERAQRIAVFETSSAYEKGNRDFADSLVDDGVTMEQHWMTSHDEKVRPEHAANEAEGWVPMDHVFSSGDTEPPTDPGCRCYMIFREKPKGGD